MDEQAFRQFIAEYTALNLSVLAEEMAVGQVNFLKIVAGWLKIPQAKRGRFWSLAQKYGFRSESSK